MKDMFMLQRIAVITLVFFSLFVMIDFVPDSVSSESSSSESCSTDGCTPMEKFRNSILNSNGAQDVELPEDFGEDVQPDPKAGATHNKRTLKTTTSQKKTVTTTPTTDGNDQKTSVKEENSASVEVKRDNDRVKVEHKESTAIDDKGGTSTSRETTVEIEVEF